MTTFITGEIKFISFIICHIIAIFNIPLLNYIIHKFAYAPVKITYIPIYITTDEMFSLKITGDGYMT